MDIETILSSEILGNSVQKYLIAAGLFLGGMLLLRIMEGIVFARIRAFFEKKAIPVERIVFDIFQKNIIPLLYLGAFYFAAKQLVLSPIVDKLVTAFCLVLLVIQSARLAVILAIYILEKTWLKKETEAGGTVASKSILGVIRVVIWGLGIVFVLDNLGFNVSAIVAGLGIGGVAVALAAQTILGDLFNYFVIFFDRPFQEGDFVIVGDYLGTIEHIGIKTTRIRSLSGEQIVVHNSDLTTSRIRNYKRMEKRRVLFTLGVTYQTPREKMMKIPQIIREIISVLPDTLVDRVHFKGFGAFSLDVETVYYVLSNDYNKYMDTQQKINLAIMEKFEKEGIEFAYPTETHYQYRMELPAIKD